MLPKSSNESNLILGRLINLNSVEIVTLYVSTAGMKSYELLIYPSINKPMGNFL